jgi:hypothetical protein
MPFSPTQANVLNQNENVGFPPVSNVGVHYAPRHVAYVVGYLIMSKRELDRAQLMLLSRERRRTEVQVAEQLGLTLRRVERLCRGVKAGGPAALGLQE